MLQNMGAGAAAKLPFLKFTALQLEPEPVAKCWKAPKLEPEPKLFLVSP